MPPSERRPVTEGSWWLPDKRAKEGLAKPHWVAQEPQLNEKRPHTTRVRHSSDTRRHCATRRLWCVTVERKEGRKEGRKEEEEEEREERETHEAKKRDKDEKRDKDREEKRRNL